MCGLTGILTDRSLPRAELIRRVKGMADAMHHRGPDDSGEWSDPSGTVAFGFRRLAVLDLTEAGHQPMVSASGRFTMVFNGEIYNFQDLRRHLRRLGVTFRGRSDSEVLLAAVEEWGLAATLKRINGMFAIALWDSRQEELTLVRDRMGIKPLYVARMAYGVAFASELGALMGAPEFDATLAPAAISSYLRYLYVPAPYTPFQSTTKLLPGHTLRISKQKAGDPLPEPVPYFELGAPCDPRHIASRGTVGVDMLRSTLSEAVRSQMVADVPVGALLSGGTDSTLVTRMMCLHASGPVKTFTVGFDSSEHDESAHARAVASYLGTEHHELMVSDREALAMVQELPAIFDEPLANPSQIPTYLLSKLARSHVTVALSGDGGDELFGGYNRYRLGVQMIPPMVRSPAPLRRIAARALALPGQAGWDRVEASLRRGGHRGAVSRLLGEKVSKAQRMLRAEDPFRMYQALLSPWDAPWSLLPLDPGNVDDPILRFLERQTSGLTLSSMMLADQRFYLPDDLLMKVDRASMANSLEVRVPLLDERVVALSWRLADDQRIRNGAGKWLLAELLRQEVPRALMDRPKTGFTVPVANWLRGGLREWSEDQLFGSGGPSTFVGEALRRPWRALLNGRNDQALGLWAVAFFEAWRKHWKIEGGLVGSGSGMA